MPEDMSMPKIVLVCTPLWGGPNDGEMYQHFENIFPLVRTPDGVYRYSHEFKRYYWTHLQS
jgi:hypothetical protein